MTDRFGDSPGGVLGSVTSAVAVTPDDTALLAGGPTRAVYVGVAGNVVVVPMGDANPVTFVNLAAGVFHPLRVTRVLATGTTATNIVAAY